MNAKEMAEQADTVKESARRFKDTAVDWSKKAATKAKDAGAATDLYVHDHLWSTVAIVAVAAGLLGFLLGRQRD